VSECVAGKGKGNFGERGGEEKKELECDDDDDDDDDGGGDQVWRCIICRDFVE